MTITEEKLNDVINGAMSRLFEIRDEVKKEVESLSQKVKAGRSEVDEIQRQQTAARAELASLIGKGQRALEDLEKIARQANALKPSLKERKDLIGKQVRMIGGRNIAVVGEIGDDGMVTCYTEQYDAQGAYIGNYEFTVPRVVLEKV
ncbi:hypothetical protein [Comamonas fluminis]|uniref:hypothetical protein n=1 Tax=Comamonas fluminis TaxID=2796366 RepID=UPI001C481CFD|nr:hypothetical protein [Comamonas fluminis]